MKSSIAVLGTSLTATLLIAPALGGQTAQEVLRMPRQLSESSPSDASPR